MEPSEQVPFVPIRIKTLFLKTTATNQYVFPKMFRTFPSLYFVEPIIVPEKYAIHVVWCV